MKVFLSPDKILLWLTGLKDKLTMLCPCVFILLSFVASFALVTLPKGIADAEINVLSTENLLRSEFPVVFTLS